MTKYFYVATELVKLNRNYVATECFCVVTEFGQGQEFLCRDRVFLCRDRVWPWMGFLCRDRIFSRRDRVWPRLHIRSQQSIFLLRPSLGQGPREFMSQHSILCHDSGVRHCVVARLCDRDKHALSR